MAADTTARVSATVIDSEGIKSTVLSHVYMDGGQTVNQIKAAVGAWAHAVDQLTGAEITALRFDIGLPDTLAAQRALYVGDPTTGIKAAPAADSEVQEVGVFAFNQTGIPYHYGQAVPALIESLTSGGTVDIADAKVTTFTGLMAAGVLGGHYVGLGTEALTTLYRAFRGDRKRRKQLYAKSVKFA